MNKAKKSDPKKILVRNTELPVPKTRLILEGKPEIPEKKKTEREKKSECSQSKFQAPELNSALNIGQKINKIEKTKSQKFQKEPDVAFCEKVTRQINFPVDQPIYKDLIPLQVPAKSPPVLTSREPLPQKDKEPVLSTYAKPLDGKEYIYRTSLKPNRHIIENQLHNLRLYEIIQLNNQ